MFGRRGGGGGGGGDDYGSDYGSDDSTKGMEASYTQISKEEQRSRRIGDEEDRLAALEEKAELDRERARAKKKSRR